MKRVSFKCPVCGELITTYVKVEEDLQEFCLIHRDHVAKIYIDREGFVRRGWPIATIKVETPHLTDELQAPPQVTSPASTLHAVEEAPDIAVFIGEGRAVAFVGNEIIQFEAEELGVAVLMAEKIARDLKNR